MSPFENGPILKFSIRTMLEFSIGTMLESSIGTMLESSTESVLHFDIHPTPIQCRKPMSFRHWNVGCRHRNDIVLILELHLSNSRTLDVCVGRGQLGVWVVVGLFLSPHRNQFLGHQ